MHMKDINDGREEGDGSEPSEKVVCPCCKKRETTDQEGDFFEVRVARLGEVTEWWCEGCRDDHSFECQCGCDTHYSRNRFTETVTEDEGDVFCYETCRGEYHYSDRTDYWYTHEENLPENNGLPEYHSCSRPWQGRYFSENHLGVELEVERDDPQDIGDWVENYMTGGWCVETDGSLSSARGAEIVGPPLVYADCINKWKPLLKMLRDSYTDTPSNAGMHINQDRAALGDDTTRRLLVLVHRYSRWFRLFTGRNSSYGAYIRQVRWANAFEHSGYHGAITACKHNRVEWRIFPSTTNEERFAAHLQLVRAATAFVVQAKAPMFENDRLPVMAAAWRKFLSVTAKENYPALHARAAQRNLCDDRGRYLPVAGMNPNP